MKSTLRVAGEILTLVGAILSTIGEAILLIFFFWTIVPIFWAPLVIVFTWVTRNIVLKRDSQGWLIFGIVLTALTDWIGLAGYICLLIDKVIRDKEQSPIEAQTTAPVENPQVSDEGEKEADEADGQESESPEPQPA